MSIQDIYIYILYNWPKIENDSQVIGNCCFALMQEMPVEQMDGEALPRCTCHVFQSSMKVFANMYSLNLCSVWQVSGEMEPRNGTQALATSFARCYSHVIGSCCFFMAL